MIRCLLHLALLLVALALPGVSQAQDGEPWFPVDTLNPGLPHEVPDTVNRRTAYSAMASFVDNLDEGRDLAAAQMLNLADIPEAEQLVRGPQLARQLGEVMERRVLIPWRRLLDRPDNLDARDTGNAAQSGEVRRSILISYIEGPRRETEIRLNRVKPSEGDPVWVFSRETVAHIAELHALHGPTFLERSMPDVLRRETVLGLARWEVIALPLLVCVALFIGWSCHRLLSRRADATSGDWREMTLNALRWPSVILVVSTVLLIATQNLLVFSGPISAILGPIVVIGYLLAFLLFGLQVIDTAMRRFVTFDMGELAAHDKDDTRSLATAMSAARRVLVILAVVVSIGYILSAAQVSSMLGLSLLASAGAMTLIVGFAARRVLGNILASLQIMMNRSARIGDQILFEGHWCTVERIHFTFVQLKVWNGDRFVVPVERFVSEDFLSYTLMNTEQVRTICLTLAQTADMKAVRDIFTDIVTDQDGVTDPEQAQMRLIDHDAFGPVARFQFPVANPDDGWITECEIRERLITRLQDLDRDSEAPVLPRQSMDLLKG